MRLRDGVLQCGAGCMLSAISVVALVLPFVPRPAAGAPATGTTDRARGLVYAGMRRGAADGPCHGAFELSLPGPTLCSAGPDPAPLGIDVRTRRTPHEQTATAAAAAAPTIATHGSGGSVSCLGDGVSGPRVQAIYAVASDQTDRYATIAPQIPAWAAAVDGAYNESANETGGSRHVRWATTSGAGCQLTVAHAVVSPTGDDSLSDTVDQLENLGFNRTDRHYVVWMDANIYCGVGNEFYDDRPDASNPNNGGPIFARIDNGCWHATADSNTETHELGHTLGAVQLTAPHSTNPLSHCTDEWDVMCYKDQPSTSLTFPCAGVEHDDLLDCNHDDYFHTDPAPGSYLATHWNAARSVYLYDPVADPAHPPLLSVNDASVTEGNTGTKTMTFTVSLDHAPASTVTVPYATADVTTTAGSDEVATSGTLTFGTNQTTRTVAVTIRADTVNEIDETFVLDLGVASGAVVRDGRGVGTILDDDAGPSVSVADFAAVEPSSGTKTIHVPVTLSGSASQTVTVDYFAYYWSAAAPGDFSPTYGTLTFPVGTTTKSIDIDIVGDGVSEGQEMFVLHLNASTGAPILDPDGVVTIADPATK